MAELTQYMTLEQRQRAEQMGLFGSDVITGTPPDDRIYAVFYSLSGTSTVTYTNTAANTVVVLDEVSAQDIDAGVGVFGRFTTADLSVGAGAIIAYMSYEWWLAQQPL